jgi:succinoglycan biosynthesis transport protein ExoP
MQRQDSSWDLTPWLDMLRRRRWLALMLFVGVLTFSVSFIAFLPNIYTASALVLVEGQQIPEDYVRPTVRMPVQQRLYNISQQALSRSRLERLGNEFHLYEEQKQRQSVEDWIETIRKAISIDVKGSTQTGAVAFSVGFSGTNPQTVMDVANTLASFYIEENLRMRETQAVGTSNFLQVQLAQVKQTLEEQEQKITDYKKRFLGELPEQLDANLKTLERLQVQLQLLSENLSRAQERRNALTYQLNAMDAAGGPVVAGPADAIGLRIQELRRQLAELQTRFRDNYPDVQMAKQELAHLERQLKTQPRAAAGASPASALVTPLHAQLKEVDGELRLLSAERASLLRDIAQYQARIEHPQARARTPFAHARLQLNARVVCVIAQAARRGQSCGQYGAAAEGRTVAHSRSRHLSRKTFRPDARFAFCPGGAGESRRRRRGRAALGARA